MRLLSVNVIHGLSGSHIDGWSWWNLHCKFEISKLVFHFSLYVWACWVQIIVCRFFSLVWVCMLLCWRKAGMGALLIAKEGGRFGFILGAFEQLNPSQNSDLFVLDLSFPFFFFFSSRFFKCLLLFGMSFSVCSLLSLIGSWVLAKLVWW